MLIRIFALFFISSRILVVSKTCINCIGDSLNSSCFTTPFHGSHGMKSCDGECQVWKVQSEISGDVYLFERSCSEVCKEGCTHIADMEHRFVACGSCCAEDLCNIDNISAPQIGSNKSLWIFLISILIKCF